MNRKTILCFVLILLLMTSAAFGVIACAEGLSDGNTRLQSADKALAQDDGNGLAQRPDWLPPPPGDPGEVTQWTGREPKGAAAEAPEEQPEEPAETMTVDAFFPGASDSDKKVILVCTKDADGVWAVTSSYHLSSGAWIVVIILMAVLLDAGLILLAATLIDRARRK